MKKITFLLLAIMFAFVANAQINFKDSESNMLQAGATKDTISIKDTYYQLVHTWHFNTNKAATIATEDPAKAGYLGTPQKASTRKGWRSVTLRPDNTMAGMAHGNLGKTQGYTGGGDPVHFASIADLRAYLSSTTLKYVENDAMQNDVDSAVTAVIDVAEGDAVLAVYPGMYKKTDTRVYYNLGGSLATSDLSFDIMTVDAGTSGKTVSVKLVVSIAKKTEGNPSVDNATGIGKGADKTDSTTVAYPGSARFEKVIYTSGEAKKSVNICKEFGLSIDTLNFKKVVIALITESSDLTPEAGVYDPVIGYDNFNFNFWLDTPVEAPDTWVAPQAGKFDVPAGESIITAIPDFHLTHNFTKNVVSKTDIDAPVVTYNGVSYKNETILQADADNGQFFIFTPSKDGVLDVCGKMGSGKKTLVLETGASIETLNPLTVKTIVANLEDEVLPVVTSVALAPDGSSIDVPTQSWDGSVAINSSGANAWVLMSFPVVEGKRYVVGVDGSKMMLVGIHFSEGNAQGVLTPNSSNTTVVGSKGQLQIIGAEAAGSVYSISGQKVADFAAGDHTLNLKSGIYIVVEKNKLAVKSIVK